MYPPPPPRQKGWSFSKIEPSTPFIVDLDVECRTFSKNRNQSSRPLPRPFQMSKVVSIDLVTLPFFKNKSYVIDLFGVCRRWRVVIDYNLSPVKTKPAIIYHRCQRHRRWKTLQLNHFISWNSNPTASQQDMKKLPSTKFFHKNLKWPLLYTQENTKMFGLFIKMFFFIFRYPEL